MVNLKTYASSGKADTTGFVPYTGGTANITLAHDIEISSNSKKLFVGVSQSGSVSYDGTNLVIDPAETGNGAVKIDGAFALGDVVTVTANTTSIDVRTGNIFEMNGGRSGTTVLSFINGVEGQMIIFRPTNDEVTIQNNINIQLSGSANFAMDTDDTLTLVRFDGKWYETSRMEV